MTLSFPLTTVEEWLNRFVSLNVILAAVAGLTLAKTIALVVGLNGQEPMAWPALPDIPKAALEPADVVGLDDENFVPWPSVLPEPAAGPEESDDDASGIANADQLPIDPSSLTEGEIQALQELSLRRQALDEREQLLDVRAELNSRAEALLDDQINRLAELKGQIEELVKGLDEIEELKLARLVKIYETMKPKAAAEIFNRLEIPVLLHVVERMKEAKSAAVLGKMDPVIARRVTTELAKKKERPTLGPSPAEGEA